MTTSWSRSPLQHLRYSGDNIKKLHKLSKSCGSRCGSILIVLQIHDCQNPQFGCDVLLISFTEVIGCVPPSRLSQFVKPRPLLPKTLHALQYHFGYCVHHLAGFVIFAQLALLCLFIILIFPILPIVGTCNIAQSGSDSNHHLMNHFFELAGCQSHVFSCFPMLLLLPIRCLSVFNSLPCPSGLSRNIILDPFLFLFIAWDLRLSSFHCRKLFFDRTRRNAPWSRTVSAAMPL